MGGQADSFISNSTSQRTPFFAYVAPIAPHEPSTPAPRDAHDYDGISGPRLPSFNEADVSDKPSWIRQLSKLWYSQISATNKRHENRVKSLQAVDDMVEGIVNTLGNRTPDGAIPLDNTYSSLEPVLHGSVTTWRSAVLPEAAANYSPAYEGIRTISTGGVPKRKYVEYVGGARELYHLDPDPHELTNSYDASLPPNALAARLQALKSCAENSCRTVEGGP